MSKKQTPHSVMIVDDDDDLLFVLEFQLKKQGYKVYTNHGGEQLITQLATQPVDVVLLDLSMNMINGRELCMQIKKDKTLSRAKVLIMSGNHDIEKVAGDCGADGFVAKPLSFPEVLAALNTYLPSL
jgi:two-component system, OmpR family, alkaline phosphatase synthesis response regulator PhoP